MTALSPRPPALAPHDPFQMGTVVEEGRPFDLTLWHLAVHMAVLGASGSGKSKFIELMLRYLLAHGQGGMLIDPHNDLADDLIAYAAYRKRDRHDDALLQRLHVLELTPQRAFALDPFAHLPHRGRVSVFEYQSLLAAKVDRTARTILRRVMEADLETMNRLKRWLKNVLYACGTAYDAKNSHWGLDQALVFTNPQRPGFEFMLEAVFPYLPPEVQADFNSLRQTKRVIDQERWVESTINRLRDLLSPLAQAVFGQHAPSLDMRSVIQKQEFVIARLGQTPHVSQDVKVTIGGLLIDEVLNVREAEENLPAHLRLPFHLIIDESGEFLGEDLQRALNDRKYRLSVCLAAQDLSTFCKGDLDLTAKVLAQCQTIVCFQQRLRLDKEVLADVLGCGNYDFTRVMQEVQRQRGWLPLVIAEPTRGTSQTQTQTEGTGGARTRTRQRSESETLGVVQSWMASESEGVHSGQATTHGDSHGGGRSESVTFQPVLVRGVPTAMIPVHSQGSSVTNGSHASHANSSGHSASTTHAEGGSEVRTRGQVSGHALALSESWTQSVSAGRSSSESVSYKLQLLANLVSEWEWNGLYQQGSISDQRERMMQRLHSLLTAEAIVSVRGQPRAFAIKVAEVKELWRHPAAKWEAIGLIKELVCGQHAYNFVPEAVLPASADETGAEPKAIGGEPGAARSPSASAVTRNGTTRGPRSGGTSPPENPYGF